MKTIKWLRLSVSRALYYSGYCDQIAKKKQTFPLVLVYHRIISNTDATAAFSYSNMHVSPSVFNLQLEFLKDKCDILNENRFYKEMSVQKAGRLRVLITFDDGWRDNYLNAWPLLRKNHVAAVIFAAAGLIERQQLHWMHKLLYLLRVKPAAAMQIGPAVRKQLTSRKPLLSSWSHMLQNINQLNPDDKKRYVKSIEKLFGRYGPDETTRYYCDWNELREVAKNSISIGAHGVSHDPLDAMPFDRMKAELRESKSALEEKLSATVCAFSFPHGRYTDECIAEAQKSGYQAAFAVNGRINRAQAGFFTYPRLNVVSRKYAGLSCGFSRSLFYCFLTGLFR